MFACLTATGKPVEGMNIKWWNCSPTEQHEEGNGITGADGRWLSNITKGERYIYEPFNIPLRRDPAYDALAHLFTFEINGYTDFMILGAEDVASHSRHTLMQKSLTNRAEWTWDFKTLYKPGAPKPTFDMVLRCRWTEHNSRRYKPTRQNLSPISPLGADLCL